MRTLPRRRSNAALRAESRANRRTAIAVALISDLIIAVAKLVAGLVSGSAAMLAESGHSFADTINEVLLGISVRRSSRSADALHPLGYGRARFLWAFVAAMASFIIGGCLSIGLAIRELTLGSHNDNPTLSWVVLAASLVADGISWVQSVVQARGEARERGFSTGKYLRRSSDPVLRAIVVEDSAALIGVAIAACGLLLSGVTHSSVPDAIASLLIGVLLALTAIGLARPLAEFLIGLSLPPPLLKQIHEIMAASPGIAELIGVQAVYVGPEEVIVTAKIRPACSTVAELATEMDKLDHLIRDAVPLVADLFIDVTAWDGKVEPSFPSRE